MKKFYKHPYSAQKRLLYRVIFHTLCVAYIINVEFLQIVSKYIKEMLLV